MKGDVFVLEVQEVFGKAAIRLEYIGNNKDKDGSLFYMGKDICDGEPILVDWQEEVEIRNWVFDANKKHREKHDPKKRWRSKGELYYFINSFFEIKSERDCEWDSDESRYKAGNYFRTRKQAKKALRIIKRALKYYQDELLKGDK